MTEFDFQAPPIVFPGQGPERAYRTAHDFLSRRFPNEALDILTPALEEDPTNSGLRQLQAWALMLRAQLGPAETVLRALVEESPDDIWARHALGRVLERQSRLPEALGHLKLAAAMSDDYDHTAAVYRVTRVLERDGENR
ncbi:tetratricopeptide repeat protein [Nocardioides sp.]|uniref:tetratricopeptide repeat protein n=1 Tax=Nocardioides sp. TaxID=35761 RepID=UPI0026267F53|nr:tetratricopeptide repeat protein [Nocardioides sp.]